MLCIAAFIIFSILGIFSASYRKLAKKGWYCVLRKITFRPCDINFSEELKGKLLGKLIFTHPKLANFLSRFANVFAFIFMILTIWSTLYVAQAGLNLYVYDTCNPQNVESCSLGGEACGIDGGNPEEFSFINTLKRLPDRWQTWRAEEYIAPTATYYQPFDQTKPIALEIIDPSCKFCMKLWDNLKQTRFIDHYNLTYIVYPIELWEEKYKFPYSYLIASYLEATKGVPLTNGSIPGDWLLLEKVFTSKEGAKPIQEVFNETEDQAMVQTKLKQYLAEIGYTVEQIEQIVELSQSNAVKESLKAQRKIVNEQIRTRKIPTIMFDGRRYDRVLQLEELQDLIGKAA